MMWGVRGCLALLLGVVTLGSLPLAADGSAAARIGILVPLEGPSRAAGTAVLRGVQGALSRWRRDHESSAVPETRVIPAQLRWGAQTDALVSAVVDGRTTVIIGAADSRTAHLAAQVVTRLKGSAVLISLSEDSTLTEIGVPWILRCPAAGSVRDRSAGEREGNEPTLRSLEAAAGDAALAALAATQACGSDVPGIRTYLSAHTFHGRTGDFTFDTQGNRQRAQQSGR